MKQAPDFDPFELLGLDASADGATIDRAYKARIRFVHPDIAGPAGLNEAKRLNVAREWLLDPDLRAQLPQRTPRWHTRAAEPPPPPPGPSSWYWDGKSGPSPKPAWEYDPLTDDPLTFDFGPRTGELRAFFDAIRSLTADERARVTYSLGDAPPLLFDEFRNLVSEQLWARSRALDDAVSTVWRERLDESTPLLFPRGRVFGNGPVVANAYAQWLLLGDVIRQRTRDADTIAALAARCTRSWAASIGHARYSAYQHDVVTFLDDARTLPLSSAERLARSWDRHMGRFLFGRPGEDWFPGSLDHPDPQLVSARLAAVDASRIEPPSGLAYEHHNAFRCGLRLTAHVLALGDAGESGRDYLRPWREALDASPSFRDRAGWGMPLG